MAGLANPSANQHPGMWLLLLLILSGHAGCSLKTALIVSDPYTDTLDNREIHDRRLEVSSRLRGINIINKTLKESTLSEIIAELAYIPDMVILSPWSAETAKRPILTNSLVIIAGGIPLENSPENVVGIALDRNQIYEEIGVIAGNIALEYGKTALVLHRGNIDSLLKSYKSTVNNQFNVLSFPVDDDITYNKLPDDFAEQSAEASVLILLAGPLNVTAYASTQDIQNPVITEFASSTGHWGKRIIASIEHDRRGMRKALLSVMTKKNQDVIVFYPGKLRM